MFTPLGVTKKDVEKGFKCGTFTEIPNVNGMIKIIHENKNIYL